jgi:Fe2+ or Zn2+ uptake regulation protein
MTPQRLAILKELDKKGHASIEEVYEEIKEVFPSISLATIYKNINALKDEDIITEVCLHQKPKFEIKKNPHGHFICKNCGKVEDIDVDLSDLNKRYPNAQKEVYIYGICKECNGNS